MLGKVDKQTATDNRDKKNAIANADKVNKC